MGAAHQPDFSSSVTASSSAMTVNLRSIAPRPQMKLHNQMVCTLSMRSEECLIACGCQMLGSGVISKSPIKQFVTVHKVITLLCHAAQLLTAVHKHNR